MSDHPKILVVEDEAIVAQDIRWMLEGFGYQVPAIADTGELALAYHAEFAPQLVLMDIRLLGELDGITTAEQIRHESDVPIVYLTAHDDENTLARAKVTAPYGYVIKPFEERELRIAVEIALHKHQLERQIKENALWLKTVLHSIGDGVLASDTHGRITFLNPIGELLTGWSFQEAVGREVTEVFRLVNGATHAPIPDPIRQALDRQQSLELPDNIFLIRKDGSEVPISDSIAPIFNAQLLDKPTSEDGLLGVVVVFRDVTEKRRTESQLRYQAFHDGLTGLPNRAWFLQRLRDSLDAMKSRSPSQFAVLFLDLDRFKLVNDSLGHSAGDRLLVEVARRLRQCVRDGDTVARFGGDEFGILLENLSDISQVCNTARRLQDILSAPISIEGQIVYTNASIGIVMGDESYQRVEDLVRDADIAMYRAKSSGKGRYEVFDAAMRDRVMSILSMENDLRSAIARGQLIPYYQPIVSLENGQLLGFEVLTRWKHPQRGIVPPSEFIPIAEETGLIVMLDRHILEAACQQLADWQKHYRQTRDLFVSVNLSTRHFAQPNLIGEIQTVLQKTNIDTRSLKLEITESALIENADSAITTVEKLREMGIGLAVDDFGTGYSSLSYLHRFPVNTLKLDRSFICRLHGDSDPTRGSLEIVRAILAMAKVMNMMVVAEGIETPDQQRLLQELECQAGQGYLFAPPRDSVAILEVLENWSTPV